MKSFLSSLPSLAVDVSGLIVPAVEDLQFRFIGSYYYDESSPNGQVIVLQNRTATTRSAPQTAVRAGRFIHHQSAQSTLIPG